MELLIFVYYVIVLVEVLLNLLCFDGVCFGYCVVQYGDLFDMYKKLCVEGFGFEVKCWILVGMYVLLYGYYDVYYLQVQKICCIIVNDFQEVFKFCDVIMGLVLLMVVWDFGVKGDDLVQMYFVDIYMLLVSFVGLFGMSVLCGFGVGVNVQCLVGLQIIGNYFNEVWMLQVVDVFQCVIDWYK